MSPEHVGAGIRWIRQDTEHPRMGQSTPEQFAIPGAAVRPTRKTKTQPLEALDYGVRTALSFEQFEHRSNGALYFLVRIERNLVVVKNQTHRQREVQFTLVRLVELAAVEARADDVKLCLGERALHAKHEAVVELGRVVTAVLVDYQRAGDGAQLEQAVPLLVGADLAHRRLTNVDASLSRQMSIGNLGDHHDRLPLGWTAGRPQQGKIRSCRR